MFEPNLMQNTLLNVVDYSINILKLQAEQKGIKIVAQGFEDLG